MTLETDQVYWRKKIAAYTQQDWADQPSIFVQETVQYLPAMGRILELGAGAGQDGLWLAQQGYQVVQTDFMDGSFSLIQQNAQKLGVSTETHLLDARNLASLEPASFDGVYAHLSLHYFDWATTQEIFAQIYRILKPQGVFAGLFNSTNDSEYGTGKQLEADFFEIHGIAKRYMSPDSMRNLAANFEVILVDDQGQTYKDQAMGVKNLVRAVLRKSSTRRS